MAAMLAMSQVWSFSVRLLATAIASARRALLDVALRKKRPSIVCLCGSTRLRTAFEEANRRETLSGHIVLSVGVFGRCDPEPISPEVKTQLDALHLTKIDMAEDIVVINVNGYIGESTRREIRYARQRGKKIRYFEEATVCVLSPVSDAVVPQQVSQPSPA
jgi:hypothetical protein